MKIEIIPATDIIGGACVRLTQGDYGRRTTYYRDPLEAAQRFERRGIRRLHMVDLDGAKAASPATSRCWNAWRRNRSKYSTAAASKMPGHCAAFDAGASRAICGSIAVREPESFAEWLAEFGGAKLILGADIRDGAVAVQGWTEQSAMTAPKLIARFAPQGLAQVICTDIARDGMLCGTSAEFYAGLQGQFPGGNHRERRHRLGDRHRGARRRGLRSVIVGKALYEGHITLEELKRCLPNA